MRYLSCTVQADCAYLIPIGDIHIGDKAFGHEGRKKLRGYIDWVKTTENARIFLMGDVFNCASRTSKTSPFETNTDEYKEAEGIFKPVRHRILGAIDGNHEARMLDSFGYSPLQSLCASLEVPYCGWSAVLELSVGHRRPKRRHGVHNQYFVYFHHTTGGGMTLGGALNRAVKLQEIIQGIDVFCGAHNHQLVTGVRTVFLPHAGSHSIMQKKVTYVDCGSYLDWDESYAEKGMHPPGKLGSPRIRFAGARSTSNSTTHASTWKSRDVHVSI